MGSTLGPIVELWKLAITAETKPTTNPREFTIADPLLPGAAGIL